MRLPLRRLHRFRRNLGLHRPLLPRPPILRRQRPNRLLVHIAHHHQRHILRSIKPREKLLRIRVLVRHRLDVRYKSHRRVPIRVPLKRRLPQLLVQLIHRLRTVLVVLPIHRQRLGSKRALRILQVLKPVRLQLQNRFQPLLRKRRVVHRQIVARIGVRRRPRRLHHRLPLLRRILLCPPKHAVLEEVRKPRLPRLHLMPRPHAHDDIHRHNVREVRRNRHEPHPVRQIMLIITVRKNLRRCRRQTHRQQQT